MNASVVALFVWSVAVRLQFLFSTPYPTGVDGYYYAVQVRSLLETAALYYPALPFAFWWLTPFAWIAGPIQGVKLGAAIGTAVAIFPAYILGRQLSGQRAAGLIAAGIVASSAQSLYLSTEFIKQGIGLTLMLGFLAALTPALAHPSALRGTLVVGLLALTALTHKLAFGIAVLVATATLFTMMLRHRPRAKWPTCAAAATLSLCVANPHWPARLAGAEDLRLLAQAWRADAEWSFATLIRRDGVHLYFRHEVLLAALMAVLLVITVILQARSIWMTCARESPPVTEGLILVAALLALPWLDVRDPEGLAMRLRLTAFVPLSACAALLFARISGALPALVRRVGAASIVILLLLLPARPAEGVVVVDPSRAELASQLEALLPPGATVITPDRHLAFMTTWHTGAAAMKSVPTALDSERTYRLITSSTLEPTMLAELEARRDGSVAPEFRPRMLDSSRGARAFLLTETGFKNILGALPPDSQRRWREWAAR